MRIRHQALLRMLLCPRDSTLTQDSLVLQEIKEIQLEESDKDDAEEMDVSDEDEVIHPPRKKMRQNDYLKVRHSLLLLGIHLKVDILSERVGELVRGLDGAKKSCCDRVI